MKKYLFSTGIIFLFFIVGCTTPKAVMQSWVGEPETDLFLSWGAPDSTVELKDGTKICTWKKVWSDDSGVHQGRQSFVINSEGKVIKWSYENMPLIMLK